MEYSKLDDLKVFLEECGKELLKPEIRTEIIYHETSASDWDREEFTNKLIEENKGFLDKINNLANVYAIFTSPKDSSKDDAPLKYIGQTKARLAKSRLTNHLFKKDEGTGASLEKIKKSVESNNIVQVSFISITPESLRHYIEEELIHKYSSQVELWNKHGIKNLTRKEKIIILLNEAYKFAIQKDEEEFIEGTIFGKNAKISLKRNIDQDNVNVSIWWGAINNNQKKSKYEKKKFGKILIYYSGDIKEQDCLLNEESCYCARGAMTALDEGLNTSDLYDGSVENGQDQL